jgi:uncharacterized protein (UPF0332 family)
VNGEQLTARAQRTVASAKLLFDAADLNGACNRAYYAMFDAARAALLTVEEPLRSEVIKTHSGLITAFSLYLIKTGRIPERYGKALRQVDQIRLIADYSDAEIESADAATAIRLASDFVEAVGGYIAKEPSQQ